ncbi:MAG: hypothetical protein HZB65_02555 [Candidatus Aenigmarchaeota archaeon]|nr:hypothetical protein [Candidatus Aenigmarchaeota archaeon]
MAKRTEKTNERNPVASAVLNFIIWGTGYIYNGKKLVLGIVLLFAWIFSLAPLFYIGISWYLAMPGLLFCIAHFLISLGIAIDGYMECRQ